MGVIENDLDEDTYIGIELPLDLSSQGVFRRSKTALQQSKSNIRNLLLTQKGERLGNPTFGCNLRSVLFEQENTDIEGKVEEEIRGAMAEFLPFIDVTKIETAFSPTNKNLLRVNIRFGLNIDSTTQENLTLNLSDYDGPLAQDPHDGFQTVG
tara:strand:- start:57 stop:515 length:459 start_codon:yes stop_codon:yes gene_type:complete